MLPVMALIGRPNVGKSTLFNYLTHTQDALVWDAPGVTRDRHYGYSQVGTKPCIVIDTPGFTAAAQGIAAASMAQTDRAIAAADIIVFMLDARAGLMPADADLAVRLRRLPQPIIVVANKIDGVNPVVLAELYQLGLGTPHPLVAYQGRGVVALMRLIAERLPGGPVTSIERANDMKVAIVGRPNVGKSTLVNCILGEERVVVYAQPGTTRDSLLLPCQGKPYTLIDTAGLRRRQHNASALEKLAAIKTQQAITLAQVVVLLLDAQTGLTAQDLSLLEWIVTAGKALVIAVNKCDRLDTKAQSVLQAQLIQRLQFVDFAKIRFIAAAHSQGLGPLYAAIDQAYAGAMRTLPTGLLNRLLRQAVQQYPPPLVKGRRIKLRYAHSGAHNPPVIVIHGNQTAAVPHHYQRYLQHYFQHTLHLVGTPLKIVFKSHDNPFVSQRKR